MYVEFVGGHGFKGVVKYLERGSRTAENPDRVGYFEMRNMLADDLESAGREMAITAAMADFIKERAGQKRRGKIKEPVRHFFLSWHQDDQPDRARMLQAADSMLDAMGMKHLQAVIVEHTDTAHKHLHIVVNRVDPDTGLAHSDKYEKRKLQKWALNWEKAHPDERTCAARELNAAARERGESTKHQPAEKTKQNPDRAEAIATPDDIAAAAPGQDKAQLAAELARMHREEWRDLSDQQKREREAQYLRQRAESDALWKQQQADAEKVKEAIKAAAALAYDQTKADVAPVAKKVWAAQFKKQERENRAFAQMGALSRASYYMKRMRDGSDVRIEHGVLKAFFNEKQTMDALKRELEQRHAAERAALSKAQNAAPRAAADKVWTNGRDQLAELYEEQKEARDHKKAVHEVEREELKDRQKQARTDTRDNQDSERTAAGLPPIMEPSGYTPPHARSFAAQSAAKHRGTVKQTRNDARDKAAQKAVDARKASASPSQQPQPAAARVVTPVPATPAHNAHGEAFAKAAAERQRVADAALKCSSDQQREQAKTAKETQRATAKNAPAYAAHTLSDRFKAMAEAAKAKAQKEKAQEKGRARPSFDRERER